jgi:hypothetical protein
MHLIGRLIVIIFAVIVASICAGMAIAWGVLGPEWHGFSGDVGERAGFWVVAVAGSAFTGAVGLLPLAILIAIGESFKIRSLLLHALAGAAMLTLGYYSSGLARPSYEESIDEPPPTVSREVQLAVAAGAVFGAVYWLIAGRNAGRWRERWSPSA